jgi:hypothetical protein
LSDCSICATPASRPLVHTFRGQEQLVGDREIRREIAHDRLGRAVHRRRVDDTSAQLDEALEDVLEGSAFGRQRPDVEHPPRPKPTTGIISPLDGMGRLRI